MNEGPAAGAGPSECADREAAAPGDATDGTGSRVLLTAFELATLGQLLERLHLEAPDVDLDAIEAASRVVNRLLFRRWQAGDLTDQIIDVETGGRL